MEEKNPDISGGGVVALGVVTLVVAVGCVLLGVANAIEAGWVVYFGYALGALGAGLTSVGIVALGVRIGMRDVRWDSRDRVDVDRSTVD